MGSILTNDAIRAGFFMKGYRFGESIGCGDAKIIFKELNEKLEAEDHVSAKELIEDATEKYRIKLKGAPESIKDLRKFVQGLSMSLDRVYSCVTCA